VFLIGTSLAFAAPDSEEDGLFWVLMLFLSERPLVFAVRQAKRHG